MGLAASAEDAAGAAMKAIQAVEAAAVGQAPHPRSWDFSQTLFENQKNLTEAKVRELAAPFTDGASFEQCIVGAETQAKLEEDVRLAARFEPDGTPIVAVNGRRGTSFGPFLFAMVLTRGVASHPAFQKLPAPNPNAHLH